MLFSNVFLFCQRKISKINPRVSKLDHVSFGTFLGDSHGHCYLTSSAGEQLSRPIRILVVSIAYEMLSIFIFNWHVLYRTSVRAMTHVLFCKWNSHQ